MDKPLPDTTQIFFTQAQKHLLLFMERADLSEQVKQELQPGVERLEIHTTRQTALNALRTTVNRQILLEDCPAGQEILAEIATWPGSIRRFTHLVVLGERGTSQDTVLAFTLGIDTYIHVQELKALRTLFEQSQKRFLYRTRLWLQEGGVL